MKSSCQSAGAAHQHGDGLQVDLAAVLVDAVQPAQVLPPHVQQLLGLRTIRSQTSTPMFKVGDQAAA